MSIYLFFQTNSGGRFIPPAICVFVEAEDVHEATMLAQDSGVYFHGVNDGVDCDCCGDRWHEVGEPLDLSEYPQNDPVTYYKEMYEMWADELVPAVLVIGKE